jgi:hypothetical protein
VGEKKTLPPYHESAAGAKQRRAPHTATVVKGLLLQAHLSFNGCLLVQLVAVATTPHSAPPAATYVFFPSRKSKESCILKKSKKVIKIILGI